MRTGEKAGSSFRGARVLGAAVLAVALAATAACAPVPSPDPAPPVIERFVAVATRTEAPVTAALQWTVSDPNLDELTCHVDVDGDGTPDRTITSCDSSDSVVTQALTAGERTVTLWVEDGTHDPVTATTQVVATAGPSETFEIDFRFSDNVRPEFRAAFEAAAARWEAAIVAGNSDQPLTLPGGLYGWTPPFDGVVDDVLIDVDTPYLDGPGSLLGQAGGYLIRPGGKQPYYGIMQLDSADLDAQLASGKILDLVTHEIGHVLGIGGGFLLAGYVGDFLGADPYFTGPAAVAAWQELGRGGRLPLENQGGLGTAYVHWRESVFNRELMTGYQEAWGSEPMSRVTIAALADLDYGVDLGAADPFSLDPASRAGGEHAEGPHLHTTPITPAVTGL